MRRQEHPETSLLLEQRVDNPRLFRSTSIVVSESDGELYMHRVVNSDGPVVRYSENALLDFAGAYYPKSLVEFAENHGPLFSSLSDPFSPSFVELPWNGQPPSTPSDKTLWRCFERLRYPPDMKTKVVKDFSHLQASYERIMDEPRSKGNSRSVWGDSSYTEALGDWVAARAVLQKALVLLNKSGSDDRNARCPGFQVSLEGAPRYSRYLADAIRNHRRPKKSIQGDMPGEMFEGFYADGGMLRYVPRDSTVSEAVHDLTMLHMEHAITLTCSDSRLHGMFDHLLQVIWFQVFEQIDGRLSIAYCENPRCENIMLKLRGDKKRFCCGACKQAIADWRRRHG